MDIDDLSKVVEDVKWDQRTLSISTKTEPLLPDLPFLTIPDLHLLHYFTDFQKTILPVDLQFTRFTAYHIIFPDL